MLALAERPRGPRARPTCLHAVAGQPACPPSWGVQFHARHVELVGAAAAAAAAATPALCPPPAAHRTSTNTACSANYGLSRKAAPELDSLKAWIAAPTTHQEDALALRQGVAALYAEGKRRLLARAMVHAPAIHNGAPVLSDMRAARPGPGSYARTKGPHG